MAAPADGALPGWADPRDRASLTGDGVPTLDFSRETMGSPLAARTALDRDYPDGGLHHRME